MVQRQLFGGPHDGDIVTVLPQVTVYVAPDGQRYMLTTDGQMYWDNCKWDEKPYDANPGVYS